jgi:hypothetical protein
MISLKSFFRILKNMGLRYTTFRLFYELKNRTGIQKLYFPTNPPKIVSITLEQWKKITPNFFFESKETIKIKKSRNETLKKDYEIIASGAINYFSSTNIHLGEDYDWITNPDSGFTYDINKHFTEIEDYSKTSGDIKYVWEKSRFNHLTIIMRYDYHFEVDKSEMVLDEIEDWIEKNPINQGPNYKCSQEITIRVFNWLFILYYYKNSINLTESRFSNIINSIYWQCKHVYNNINFSRIAVRNNHAISETLGIYTFGILFPFFNESKNWKLNGRKWLEKEIAYQIYTDGTFLQFSMNYHRVVVQLLTYAIQINKLNDIPFDPTFYHRVNKSIVFLYNCMNKLNGNLPNYGANDGAIFFKLCTQDYRDYRPQLESLTCSMSHKWTLTNNEEKYWFGIKDSNIIKDDLININKHVNNFPIGGYYLFRDSLDNSLTFIRCGNHKDRPSQADNLHIDIWVNDQNILRDAGSYKYNTDQKYLNYFASTKAHNSLTIDHKDQMLKGDRFIWYYWSQKKFAELIEHEDFYYFKGTINSFTYLDKNFKHTRIIKKKKGVLSWEIIDEVETSLNAPIQQYWHPSEYFIENYYLDSKDEFGNNLNIISEEGFYSSLYGQKDCSQQLYFETKNRKIITTIKKLI